MLQVGGGSNTRSRAHAPSAPARFARRTELPATAASRAATTAPTPPLAPPASCEAHSKVTHSHTGRGGAAPEHPRAQHTCDTLTATSAACAAASWRSRARIRSCWSITTPRSSATSCAAGALAPVPPSPRCRSVAASPCVRPTCRGRELAPAAPPRTRLRGTVLYIVQARVGHGAPPQLTGGRLPRSWVAWPQSENYICLRAREAPFLSSTRSTLPEAHRED